MNPLPSFCPYFSFADKWEGQPRSFPALEDSGIHCFLATLVFRSLTLILLPPEDVLNFLEVLHISDLQGNKKLRYTSGFKLKCLRCSSLRPREEFKKISKKQICKEREGRLSLFLSITSWQLQETASSKMFFLLEQMSLVKGKHFV